MPFSRLLRLVLLPWLLLSLPVCPAVEPGQVSSPPPPTAADSPSDAASLIGWLLQEERELTGIPFADVLTAATGHRMLPFNPSDPVDAAARDLIAAALDSLIQAARDPAHPIHRIGRINEVSGDLEEFLLAHLDAHPAFSCAFPPNRLGEFQRSGYPDLRLRHDPTGRVYYLDPKLHEEDSETSSFRTFYYEPRNETNKVNDDAVHFIAGIRHAGRQDGRWHLTGWSLVDLSSFRVKLKAEFQASNRDLYRPQATVADSRSRTPTKP